MPSIQCPFCNMTLRLQMAYPAGTVLKCGQCGQQLRLANKPLSPPIPASALPAPVPPRAPRNEGSPSAKTPARSLPAPAPEPPRLSAQPFHPSQPPHRRSQGAPSPSLFISYRRNDSPDTVKLIYERLKQRLPRWQIFYDHDSIPLGEQFPERLRAKVTSATVVLVIIGPRWLGTLQARKTVPVDHVRAEVQQALQATTVMPILVGHAAMPTETDLADFPDLQPLLQRNGRAVRPDPDFDGDLKPIIAYLQQFDSDEGIGATLADKYVLTAEVGHGGMGVVYRAEQKQPVRRTVAVKLIKPGMDSRDILARFDAERQALAVMDHPNIARVLDAGMTAQGRPFFVMDYVKGVPITQYCDEKMLRPQERLELFIPVCNALQHAHQKGIIHRDIKPTNVLVEVIDGKPVAKVIDFGLAKALGHKLTDKTLYTDMNRRVGTLEYSAPEQAAGRSFDVDTRSDVYSLGVLLYELLTGAPPFPHEELLKVGEEEMRRVIREVEPPKPSKKLSGSGELPAIAANRQLEPKKLTRLVQGDLDWIVMKCLEKENARRYETANQLAEELVRFLADEPVQAGPPSAGYRARKFLRRNKGAVIAVGLVVLALILGMIGTSIGLILADQARDAEAYQRAVAERNEATAKKAADDAQKATALAKKAADDAENATALEKVATKNALEAAKSERDARKELEKVIKALTSSEANLKETLDRLDKALKEKDFIKVTELKQHLAIEQILRETLVLCLKWQPDAWSTFNTKSRLGGALLGQRKYVEAESLLKEGYLGMKVREKMMPPEAKPRLIEALKRLIQFYDARGNAAEAERWRKELAARQAAEKAPVK